MGNRHPVSKIGLTHFFPLHDQLIEVIRYGSAVRDSLTNFGQCLFFGFRLNRREKQAAVKVAVKKTIIAVFKDALIVVDFLIAQQQGNLIDRYGKADVQRYGRKDEIDSQPLEVQFFQIKDSGFDNPVDVFAEGLLIIV